MGKKLYIGRLSSKTTDQDLTDLFSEIGEVVSAEMANKISFNSNTDYGYVVMKEESAAKEAVQKLNNTELKNSNIQVMEAHPVDQGKLRSYRRRRGYRGKRRY